MTTALVPTAPPAVPDLIRTFLDGRSPHTLTAYRPDLDDPAQFLTGTRRGHSAGSSPNRPQQPMPKCSAIPISTDEPFDVDGAPDPEACDAENAVHLANVASFLADFIAHLETKPGSLGKEAILLRVVTEVNEEWRRGANLPVEAGVEGSAR